MPVPKGVWSSRNPFGGGVSHTLLGGERGEYGARCSGATLGSSRLGFPRRSCWLKKYRRINLEHFVQFLQPAMLVGLSRSRARHQLPSEVSYQLRFSAPGS